MRLAFYIEESLRGLQESVPPVRDTLTGFAGGQAEALPAPEFAADAVPVSGFAADSLQAGFSMDSLSVSGLAADSLSAAGFSADTIAAAVPDPVLHIFGQESYRVFTEPAFPPPRPPFTADPVYQLALLALLVFYLYVMMRYRSEAVQLLRLMFGRKREGRSPGDQQSVLSAFVDNLAAVFVASVGIAVTRGIDLWATGTGPVLPEILMDAPVLIVLAVMLAICAVLAAQWVALRIAGAITFGDAFIGGLLWQRRLFMALLTVAAAPLAIIMSMAPPLWASVAGYALLGLTAIIVLWFSARAFRLFVSEKVSILVWFLYLCTVEMVPYGILAAAALRAVAV